MKHQNLIIYNNNPLYNILKELELYINFKIFFINSQKSLFDKIRNFNNFLIITNKKYLEINNQFILDELPINIFKLVEKLNTEFLKLQFNSQSEIKIKNYIINLNSREMLEKSIRLKLTEKEINTIIYLSKFNKPINIEELKKEVWSYQSNVETHTVETHIYRLRKKILNTFNDSKFIISKQDGYQIDQKKLNS